MTTNNYQSPYTSEYDNYLTHSMSRKALDGNGIPVNPYIMGNFGTTMPLMYGLLR